MAEYSLLRKAGATILALGLLGTDLPVAAQQYKSSNYSTPDKQKRCVVMDTLVACEDISDKVKFYVVSDNGKIIHFGYGEPGSDTKVNVMDNPKTKRSYGRNILRGSKEAQDAQSKHDTLTKQVIKAENDIFR